MATSPEISARSVPAKDLVSVVTGKPPAEQYADRLFRSDPQDVSGLDRAAYRARPVTVLWINRLKTSSL